MKRVAEGTAESEEAAHPMRAANHRRVERPPLAFICKQGLVNRVRTCAGRERGPDVARKRGGVFNRHGHPLRHHWIDDVNRVTEQSYAGGPVARRVSTPQFVQMYAYGRRTPAGQQRRTALELRKFFLDRAQAEKLLVLEPDQRGESETADAGHYQDAAVGMEFRSENVGKALGPIDIDDEKRMVVLRAREFDPDRGAHRGRRPIGANDQAGAHLLLAATVRRQHCAAYAPAIFEQPHNAGAITNLDPLRRLRGFDNYALDFRMRKDEIRIGHAGQRERNIEQKAGAIMKELHAVDFASASSATSVERTPSPQHCGNRRQQTLAAIEIAGAEMPLDQENPQVMCFGERQGA